MAQPAGWIGSIIGAALLLLGYGFSEKKDNRLASSIAVLGGKNWADDVETCCAQVACLVLLFVVRG